MEGREGPPERVELDKPLWSQLEDLGEEHSLRARDSLCKGPEVGQYLESLRSSKRPVWLEGGSEGKSGNRHGVRGQIAQGLGKAHGSLVPGTKYVLSKHEPLSLMLGAGKLLEVLINGMDDENLVFRALVARCCELDSQCELSRLSACHYLQGPCFCPLIPVLMSSGSSTRLNGPIQIMEDDVTNKMEEGNLFTPKH